MRNSECVALLVVLVSIGLAKPAAGGVTWELVPGTPNRVTYVATDGTDLAVVFNTGANGGDPTGPAPAGLLTRGGWEVLPLPESGGIPITGFTAVALSSDRLVAADLNGNTCGSGLGAPGLRIWQWDRAGRKWTLLAEAPKGRRTCEVSAGLEIDGNEVLVLMQDCRMLRWTGSAWEIPDGWPAAALSSSWCYQPFVRDSGRLFAVAGAVLEYRQRRIEYPLQPEGPERTGVAVLPTGLAYLQHGSGSFSDRLFLPGSAEPVATPLFTLGPLFKADGKLCAGAEPVPVCLSEGRWSYTRTAETPRQEYSPRIPAPFVELGETVYAPGLWAGRPSIRRLLPVVVRGTGVGGESFQTDLMLSNTGSSNVTAHLELRPRRGIAGGVFTADLDLAAGTGRHVPDAISLFQEAPGAPAAGSLAIRFEGTAHEADVWAGADVVSSLRDRTMRTFVPAVQWGSGPGFYIESAVGPIPRLDPSIRTNVAWADAGDVGPLGPLGVPFQMDGRGGSMEFLTSAGQWSQRSLAELLPGLQEGGVLGISGPIYNGGPNCCWGDESISPRDVVAYAVEVDQGSGDGLLTVFETLSLDTDRSTVFFPAVVRADGRDVLSWSSELRLGRGDETYPAGTTVQLTFRGEIGGSGRTVVWSLPLGHFAGVRLDVAAEVVRQAGLADTGQAVVGTLSVSPDKAGSRAIFGEIHVMGRRDGAPGRFGVNMLGVPAGRWASEKAVVPGLSDDRALRSNLAVAKAGADGTGALTLHVDLRRAADGVIVGSDETTLGPGERRQWTDIGATLGGAGSGDLYATFTRVAGKGRFVAYGVVHERASGDGAERPMAGVE